MSREPLTRVFAGTSWSNIIRVGAELDEKGLAFSTSFRKNIGEGKETRLWKDVWVGNKPLKEEFGRLFRLETDKDVKVAERGEWVDQTWKWVWNWRRQPRGRGMGEWDRLS